MFTEITVPDIGDFESVEIIEILVKAGDVIKTNDPIVTLESDKSSVEVPSPFDGKISSLKVKIGDKVSKGSILASIENDEKKENISIIKKEEDEKKTIIKKEENILPVTEKIIKQAESAIIEKPKDEINKNTNKVFARPNGSDIDPIETREWLDSLDSVYKKDGTDRVQYLLKKLIEETNKEGSNQPLTRITPYTNTISADVEVRSPGDQNIERRIRS